jgi:hypothetical protein
MRFVHQSKIKTTRMKLLTLSMSFLLAAMAANAQHRFFISTGLNFAKADYGPSTGATFKPRMGFDGGVGAEFKITRHFAIQPEINYSMQGVKAESSGYKTNFELNYITMPVLAKLQPVEGFSAFAGPQIGILTSANVKSGDDPKMNAKSELKALDYFGVFGLEYRLPMGVFIGARYQVGFRDAIDIKGVDAEIKNNALTFRIGYSFPFSGAAGKK